jgi:hypothetical protein
MGNNYTGGFSTNSNGYLAIQNGDVYTTTVSNPSGGSGGSPVNFQQGSLASNVAINTAFTSNTAPLSAMQSVSTVSITPTSANSQIYVCCTFPQQSAATTNLQATVALYSSLNTTTPLNITTDGNGTMSTAAPNNNSTTIIDAIVPSSGTSSAITFTAAAAYRSSPYNILSSGFYLYAWEVLPNTPGVAQVASTNLATGGNINALFTGSSTTTYSQTTSLGTPYTFQKNYSDTSLLIRTNVCATNFSTTQNCFFAMFLFISAGSSLSSSQTFFGNIAEASNAYGTIQVPQQYSNVGYQWVVPASYFNNSTGTYTLAFGGQCQTSTTNWKVDNTPLVTIQEVSEASYSGVIDLSTGNVSGTVPSFSSTIPTYNAANQIGTYLLANKATGSTQLVEVTATSNAATNNVEEATLLAFYDSNVTGAAPIANLIVSAATSGPGQDYNVQTSSLTFPVPSTGANTTITLYACAVSQITGYVANSAGIFAAITSQELLPAATGAAGVTTVSPQIGSYLTATPTTGDVVLNTTRATPLNAGLIATPGTIAANQLVQMQSTGAVGANLTSTDASVVITPASGSIDLSSPLNLAVTPSTTYLPTRSNNLQISSTSPSWTAAYLTNGVSSSSLLNIYDQSASFNQALTATSSQLNLDGWVRFTVTTALSPSTNTTVTPQWILALQPSPVTQYQSKIIDIIVTPVLLNAGATQAQAFTLNSYYSATLGVNVTSLTASPTFTAMNVFPLAFNINGQTATPTVNDTPPWLVAAIVPFSSSPSGLYTAGSVLVISAQWLLSASAGLQVAFNVAMRTQF